jgi:hypothetical protein
MTFIMRCFLKRIERGLSRIKRINADDDLSGFKTDFIHASMNVNG